MEKSCQNKRFSLLLTQSDIDLIRDALRAAVDNNKEVPPSTYQAARYAFLQAWDQMQDIEEEEKLP